MKRIVSSFVTIALVFAANRIAHAEDAATIFARGVKEHDAGKCEASPVGDIATCSAAAEDFKQAYALSPTALGALRDLAYTERGLGRIASATRHFRELAEKAPNDPKPERKAWAKFAREEADALAPRVPHLTVRPPASPPAGMIAQLDDAAVVLSTSMDLEPGEHRVHAEAPGFQPFDAIVQLDEHDEKFVTIELVPVPAAPVVVVAKPAPQVSSPPPPAKDEPPTHHSHVAPTVVALSGAGVAAIGLAFGGAALYERNQNCDAQKRCDPSSLNTAHDLADASSVFVVLGAAALATGIVWYFVVPSDSSKASASIVATPRSVSAIVRF